MKILFFIFSSAIFFEVIIIKRFGKIISVEGETEIYFEHLGESKDNTKISEEQIEFDKTIKPISPSVQEKKEEDSIMPSLNDCIKYYEENREMNEWFNDTIESICDENDLDSTNDDDIKKAILIGKDTIFKEIYDILKDDITSITQGNSIFRAFSLSNIPKEERKDFFEKLKKNLVKGLGEHWTNNLATARYIGNQILLLKKPWIVIEAKIDHTCIDIKHSFCMRDAYPEENEIIINDLCEIKIVAILESEVIEEK